MTLLTPTDISLIQQLESVISQNASLIQQVSLLESSQFSAAAVQGLNNSILYATDQINTILIGSTPLATATAQDENYVVEFAKFVLLPPITAHRQIQLPPPSASGDTMVIWNQNNTGFVWSTSSPLKTPLGTLFTGLDNQTFYDLIADGAYWVSKQSPPS